jgi:hypothetical protein
MAGDDPRNWRLNVPDDAVALYLGVAKNPRPLTAPEVTKLVDVIDAWRDREHRKHIALTSLQSQSSSPE